MQFRHFLSHSAAIPDRVRLLFIAFALLILFLTGTLSKAIAQTTSAAEIFDVQLGRVHAEGFVLEQSGTVTITATCLDTRKTRPLSSNAWILDAATRTPVWDFDDSDSDRRGRSLLETKTEVRLPAGAYEVYYASSLDWNEAHWSHGGIGDVVRNVVDEILDRNKWDDWGDWEEKFDELRGDLGITVRTTNSVRRTSDMEALAKDFLGRAFVTISGIEDDNYSVRGFELERPMQVNIYALGEMIDEDRYDYGWIIDTSTRRKIWEMNRRNSEHAGGAKKNRMSRDRFRLDQGRYAIFYVSDGSHSTTEWNAPPPYDPDFWGITLLASNAGDVRNVSTFDYENVPLSQAVVKIREVRDDEHRTAGFSLSAPIALRIYALGEGRSGHMFDYGWIMDADTRSRVWSMDFSDTEHAGGASKNRLYDRVVDLDAGNYEAHYITDDSHAFNEWNSDRPFDPAAWGMTIVPANPNDANRIGTLDPRSDKKHLAQIVRVGDNEEAYTDFTIDRDARVRVYAIGEGSEGHMYDYGWIEDRGNGQAVWEMTYRMTEHAGGARKNRMVNTVVMLPAGRYRLHYQSDGSHSYEDWNASPPMDVDYYGISVTPESR